MASFVCSICDGNREVTVSPDNDPQHDYQKTCAWCHGSGNEPCCYCSRSATAQAWATEKPGQTKAHLLHYCTECLAAEKAQGRVVFVVPQAGEQMAAVGA